MTVFFGFTAPRPPRAWCQVGNKFLDKDKCWEICEDPANELRQGKPLKDVQSMCDYLSSQFVLGPTNPMVLEAHVSKREKDKTHVYCVVFLV